MAERASHEGAYGLERVMAKTARPIGAKVSKYGNASEGNDSILLGKETQESTA